MIPCPVCGANTAVKETRGNRRRRWCSDFSCTGRLSTVEMPLGDIQMIKKLVDANSKDDGNE